MPEPIENRLARLEQEIIRGRRRLRGTQAACLGLAGLFVVGFEAMPAVSDVLQTQRLEIVDSDGKLILAASGDENGGRLDVWTPNAQNVVRLSANAHGGDVNVWNKRGVSVAGLFANPVGGEMGLWEVAGERRLRATVDAMGGAWTITGPGGTPLVGLQGDAGGGRLSLASADGPAQVTLAAGGQGGRVEVAGPAGQPVVRLESDARGSGRLGLLNAEGISVLTIEEDAVTGTQLHLSDRQSNRRVTLAADEAGGAMSFYNAGGQTTASLGTAPATSGGYLDLANAAGTRIFAAAADTDGCGRLDVGNLSGQFVFSVDGIADVGAGLGMRTDQGQTTIVIGARPEGGLLHLFNGRAVPILVAGYADGGPGGALSLMNERGLPVVHAASDEQGQGIISVYDADGRRPRSLQFPK